jgi:hypothetical protein
VCLEQIVTGPHSQPKKCTPHIPKLLLENPFQIIIPLMAMTSKKSLLFRIAIQISKVIWHPQYNTKKETVKRNFTVSS